MSDLAIDGGRPVRESPLPYGRQFIDDEDARSVLAALQSNWITRGPKVAELEEVVADYVDMPYAVAFHTATSGLHAVMAMYAQDKKQKVAVPAVTFAATANSVLYTGGDLDFVDTDEATMNIDIERVSAIDADIIYSVDFAGNPVDYDELRSKTKAVIVDDAAHSLGSRYKEKPIGSQADVSVFSFHPVKSVTMGEGGVVVVKDEAQRDFLRAFRNHGITDQNHKGYYTQEMLGFNYHVTEMQAALGLSQLKKLDSFIYRRNQIAANYDKALAANELVQIPKVTTGAMSAWHLYPLRLNLEKLKVDRDQFIKALRAENINAQMHYIPVYWHEYYQRLGFKKGLCPNAEESYLREISLPIFPAMTDEDQSDVLRALDKLFEAYRAS